jgi:hypothetical protein
MNDFWIGTGLAFGIKLLSSASTLIAWEDMSKKIRTFIIWIPYYICTAFLIGFLVDILFTEKNESSGLLFIIICLLINLFLSYIIEHNKSFLRKVWLSENFLCSRLLSSVVYMISLFVSFIPYIIYYNLTGLDFKLLILMVFVFLLTYVVSWNLIKNGLISDLTKNLTTNLNSFLRSSFLSVSSDDGFNFFEGSSSEELAFRRQQIDSALSRIYLFNPVLKENELSFIKESILPINTIKDISENLIHERLNNLLIESKMIICLIGTDAEYSEGIDYLKKKNLSASLVQKLYDRRLELKND